MTPADRLQKVVSELIAGQQVDPHRFFEALAITQQIASDCARQNEQLQAENDTLQRNNNRLAWLALEQARTIKGEPAYEA